jgi:hypothetical protein
VTPSERGEGGAAGSPNRGVMRSFAWLTPLAALVATLAVFVVTPVASSGFLADDQFNSAVNGWLAENGVTLSTLAWRNTVGFLHETSRFIPGFYYQAYGLFHVLPDLAQYKAVQITMLLLDVALFAWLLRLLRLSAGTTALAVLFALTSMQFHGHYDGYLGFSATAEFWLALTLASWGAFAWWLRSENGNWGLRIAVVLYLVAVLNYETCYPMSLGHVLIAMHLRGRRAWLAGWPFLAVTAAAGLSMVVARALFPQPPNADYSLHILTFGYVRTVFYQVTASLPLAYLAFFKSKLFPPGVPFWSAAPVWLLSAVALVSAAAAFAALRALAESSPRRLIFPAALGAWLWCEAALLLAAIPRYQLEVGPGYGYGPMVLGGFGAALVLACAVAVAFAKVPSRARGAAAAVFAIAYAVVLTASFETNQRTLVIYEGERAAQINLTAALRDGVAAPMTDGATLLSDAPMQLMRRYDAMADNRRALDNPRYFVREHSGRSVRVRGIYETPPPIACGAATCEARETFALHDVPLDARDGYTAFGAVSRVTVLADGSLHPWATAVRLHVRGDRLATLSEHGGITVSYACAADGAQRSARLALAPDAIRSGAVMTIPAACPVDLESVQLAAAAS